MRFLPLETLELSLGVSLGLSVMGVGQLGDKIGGFGTASVGIGFRPVQPFAVTLTAEPTLILATLESDQLGSSFTLPILLRFDVGF